MVCSTVFVVRLLVVLAVLCAPLAACGGEAGVAATGGEHRLDVVATTTQATDFARQVGGDRIVLTGLPPANADPHEFEVRPDDLKALAGAALVISSGGEVDHWLDGAIDSSGSDADVLRLGDHVML